MARKDIKQKVNIEFIGHGLNELEKSLDKVSSKISGKQNLRNFEKIKNDILAMQTVIAESGGVVSEDLFKSFKQDFDNVLRQFDKIRRSLVPELDKQSSAELSVLSDTIARLESDLRNLKEARTASKRNIKFDEQDPYDESK